MKKKILLTLALALATAAPPCGQVPKARKANVPPPGIYSQKVYQEAREALLSGDLPGALQGFCDMVNRPQGQAVWTVSVVLLCDPAEIPQALQEIREPQPVFVVKRIFEGRTCFRVCAGLTTDRGQAVAMRVRLPEAFKSAGPFPVEVPFRCDSSIPGFQRPARSTPAPAGTAPSEDAKPVSPPAAAPVGPARPEVLELTPVPAPTAQAPSPGPSPISSDAPASGSGPSPFAQQPLVPGPGLPPSPPPPGLAQRPSKNPEAEAWFQKGLKAYNLGDRKLAEASYKSCLELNPDKPEALTNLGILYIEEKKFKDARGLLETAVAKAPNYSRGHLGLAGALWGLEEYGDAIGEARAAVNLDTHNVNAHLTLASFLRTTGQEEEAMKEARLVLLMEPNNPKALEFLNTPPPKKVKKIKEKKD